MKDDVRNPAAGKIRRARSSDASALLQIYTPFIENTAVTFETEPPSVEEFAARIVETSKTHPWLVFEMAEGIVGYAYGSKHRPRAACQWAAETTVYIAPTAQRSGIGRLLYERVLEELEALGYRIALGVISLPNEGSVALHQAMGFEPVGTYKKIGFKLGRWHDTQWWQKRLGASDAAPEPLRRPSSLGEP